MTGSSSTTRMVAAGTPPILGSRRRLWAPRVLLRHPSGLPRPGRVPNTLTSPALVAQGIEHRPPEPGAKVRILPRALSAVVSGHLLASRAPSFGCPRARHVVVRQGGADRGPGQTRWPRPGRMAAARSHTFEQLATAIDAAVARWDPSPPRVRMTARPRRRRWVPTSQPRCAYLPPLLPHWGAQTHR